MPPGTKVNGKPKSIPNSLAIAFIAFFAFIASTAEELIGINLSSPPPSNNVIISDSGYDNDGGNIDLFRIQNFENIHSININGDLGENKMNLSPAF